ncbi:Predicted metal-dependent hydrolase, TIM-barrel fold [Variovorax sp. HW608]|uniref:amidohydrolase family protein n=1 Tax=Variovorax sp. HW608 TaxID=1034889 RepID=UPI00081F9F9A|nr:amidohydrolase family protein [Variovorax sp. HW608]SCK17011.1 Predicted metal-dependent hydrolase, TIM-barrel fold [Variovorax sp. HW608]
MTKGRIDTHQHIVPPAYAAWLDQQGVTAGGLPIPKWSAEGALDLMESARIETGILSVSTPGVHLGDDGAARSMARLVNEFAADAVRQHPGRFGFFATLTLPDVDGALAEAAHALDVLGADGVVLLTNVRGVYLGDASIEPLMEELERRKAVVFVHPSELPAPAVPGIPPFAADFLLDTTRAGINMARRAWLERYPNVKIILSHGGGFIPYAAERIARMCSPDGDSARGIENLRRFYFDTALASSPYALPSLLAFADPSHVFFGSDWPYAPKERSLHFAGLLDKFELGPDLRMAIERGNAERVFRRLAV